MNEIGNNQVFDRSLKHEAVKEILLAGIATQHYKVGQRLPSVRELARQCDVSIAPVCRAVESLCQDGVITKIPGRRGMFVADSEVATQKQVKLDSVAIVYEGAKYQADGGASKVLSQLMVESFMDAMRDRKFEVRVITHRPVVTGEEDAEMLAILARFKVVVFPDAAYLHWAKHLETQGCRVLFMCNAAIYAGVNRVRWDLGAGVELLVDHLVQLGHKRILFVDVMRWFLGQYPSVKFMSYCLAMQRHGLPVTFVPLAAGYELDAYRAVRNTIPTWRDEARPTGIVGGNDLVARGVLVALHEAGMKVPQDISVAGIDGRPESALTAPPLTTVAINYAAIVAAAVEWVDKVFSDNTPPVLDVTIPTKLVVRESTAAPRAE